MTSVFVLIIVIAALVLLSLVRIGGEAYYDQEGLKAWLKVGPWKFLLYPGEKKKKQKKDVKKPRKSLGGTFQEFREMLPYLLEAVGQLKRKIRIDRIVLDVTVAAADPAFTAIAFGGANAFLGMIWPAIENNFNVKDRSITTQADFDGDQSRIRADAVFTMTIGQLVVFGCKYGLGGLVKYQKMRKAKTEERKADLYGTESSHS